MIASAYWYLYLRRPLVAYGGDGLIAIEVKRTRTIRRADIHALKQFRIDYPMARCVLLFGGDRRERGSATLLRCGAGYRAPVGRQTCAAGNLCR